MGGGGGGGGPGGDSSGYSKFLLAKGNSFQNVPERYAGYASVLRV